MSLAHFFYLLESLGIVSFALSGMLMAEQKNFDPVGWYIIACVTAFGGGTLRDLILDNHPVYWISHWEYPVIIFWITALFYFISKIRIPYNGLIVTDTIGLALFTITGTQTALYSGHPATICMILAVIGATFGGLIRDVLCNEVPMIFQKVSFYASVSFVGSGLYILLLTLRTHQLTATILASLFIIIFRLLAYRYNWRFR